LSSILTALKKLEGDANKLNKRIPWPIKTPKRLTSHPGGGRTGRYKKYFFLITAIFITAAIGGLLQHQESLSIKKLMSGTTVSIPDQEMKVSKPAPKVPDKPPSLGLEIKTPHEASVEKKSGPPDVPSKKILAAGGAKPSDLSPVRNQIRNQTGNQIRNENKKKTPAMVKQPPLLEQIDETGLKLHAIAWSSDPQKRIAVINGRIVREGESIEGFSVTHIGAEEVVVREGEKAWKLVFRLH